MSKYIILSIVLFVIGSFGMFLSRKHFILILISFELIILSINFNFVVFSIFFNKKKIFAKIPGIGEHYLQTHSIVMVRGHGPKDSPGINYHLIRGLCDFVREESFGRMNRRSKFGLKKII